jgi:hypothetical protein
MQQPLRHNGTCAASLAKAQRARGMVRTAAARLAPHAHRRSQFIQDLAN